MLVIFVLPFYLLAIFVGMSFPFIVVLGVTIIICLYLLTKRKSNLGGKNDEQFFHSYTLLPCTFLMLLTSIIANS